MNRSVLGQALRGLAFSAAVLMGSNAAHASSFSVNPVRITLSAKQPVAAITVRNADSEQTVVQLEATAWTQVDGKDVQVPNVKASVKVAENRKGVGVVPGFEDATPIVAAVLDKSPAAAVKDGIPAGSLITAVDGKAVATWFDVRAALADKSGEHTLTLLPPNNTKPVDRILKLAEPDAQAVAALRLEAPLRLGELITDRKTKNPVTAMKWGVLETRDLILQFYVTLQRMFGGTVSASNLMGPVGIIDAGARFAFKGNDWLVWFLAMISANLAVVNFLPIPIVDGGLFVFLIIEKIQGRPLSRRTQEFAQLVGLALILSVFLFVTYNDIARKFVGH